MLYNGFTTSLYVIHCKLYLIQNFNTAWNDGRALCGTVDKLRPGACPNHLALDSRDGLENCRLGMDLAERLIDIPKVLSPEDLNSPDVDDLSVMTYVSYFCDPANQQLLQWIRKKIPQRNIKNLSSDWNNGINLGALAEACFPGLCPDWESMEPTDAIDNLKKMIKLIKDRLNIEPPVGAADLANPAVDEIVVATYLMQFRNAKLRASPEEFSLSVPSLPKGAALVHEPVTFGINIAQQAVDLAKDIKITAHGPSSDIAVKVAPKDGNLQATFVPTEAGSYELFAAYQGEHISGSPFSLPVADPSKCQIFGDIPKNMQVGTPESFVVKTRGAGKAKFTCTFDDGKKSTPTITCETTEQENEQFEVELEPKSIGEALVEPKWASVCIPQAPFRVSICDASKCQVSGDNLLSGAGKVGEPVEFKLKAKPREAGVSKPVVKPRGPSSNYTPEIRDNGDDTYDVSFTPWEVGPHKVEVLWGGANVPKSPFSMNVTPAPDANTCSATGKGLKKAIAGELTSFNVLAPEKGLLKKPDGLKITVSTLNKKAPVEIVDNNDGVYKVSYTAPDPGAYVTEIKFYDKHIPGSPFKLDIVPAPNASKCRAYGPALHPNSLHIAGTPLDLFVDTNEAGKGELQVEVKGPDDTKPKVFIANDRGTYSLKFDVPEPGKYNVHVWWSRVYIPGSPFKIRVHPGPNAGMVKAYGPGLEPSFEVGETSDFTIETKNAGIGTLTVRVHGVKGAFKIDANAVSKSDPRTLKAQYDPKEPGDYIIAIRWSGNHVPGSPFSINIRAPPKKKKEKKKESFDEEDGPVLPEPVDEHVMTKEQIKAYRAQMKQRGQVGMVPPGQVGYNPYMVPGYPAQRVGGGIMSTQSQIIASSSKRVEKSSKGATSQVRIQEEPSSTVYYEKEKKKKKRKF